MRPQLFSYKPRRVVVLEARTGKGYTQDGQAVTPVIDSRRKTPTLNDLLNTGYRAAGNIAGDGDVWIMLTGKKPLQKPGEDHPFQEPTAEWVHGTHWLSDDPTGRYEHTLTGQKIVLSYASAWFGATNLTPKTVGYSWWLLTALLNKVTKGAMKAPMDTPGATGARLWALSLSSKADLEVPTPEIADLIHATSGQHHIGHLVAGPNADAHPDCLPLIDPSKTPRIPGFSYVDGRFMYAALTREIGVGPIVQLTRSQAADLYREDPYARVRYKVTFTVPDTWEHIGLIGTQDEDTYDWHWPNRPGAKGTAWVDAAELRVATAMGWVIDFHEALHFTGKGDPLRTYSERIVRARTMVTEARTTGRHPAETLDAVEDALRNVLLHSIGRFAARGRGTTRTATTFNEIPAEWRPSARAGANGFTYTEYASMTDRQLSYYHPEIAAQIWGGARARLLISPSAYGAESAGVLDLDPHTVIGVQGDAVFTTALPKFALPAADGGGDDGRIGRLRLKGHLAGDLKTPTTLKQRDALRDKAQRAGYTAEEEK